MPNRFEAATTKGLAAIQSVCGVSVSLTRGATTIFVIALRGASEATRDNAQGVRLRQFDRDYLIDAADYDFGGGPVEPALGDQLVDDGRTFEVHNGGDGPAWDWHDRQGIRYRIHCLER